MDIDLVGYVRRELKSIPRAKWSEIAERAGVSKSTLEKYVYGVTENPSAARIQALAHALMNRDPH